MNLTHKGSQLSDLLEQVAIALDIPDHVHEDAVKKYEEVSHWLEEKDQQNGRREPAVYPQGSFRIGTAIRPLSEADEYDVDLVYERALRKSSISQEQLKREAGEHLESYVEYCRQSYRDAPTLERRARCWRLDFPGQFHMDILPAIPDDDARRRLTKADSTAILITDRDVRDWQFSNPIGYADWFKARMQVQFVERRQAMARELLEAQGCSTSEFMLKEAAEAIPEYKVKTPLQRAIQILKRHRDFYFQDDEDFRPVSIILTTLAAQAYNNEASLVDSLLRLVRGMPRHILTRTENGRRVSWVPNPINANENFADRWQDPRFPGREAKFRGWLDKVDEDLTTALHGGGIHTVFDRLVSCLGRKPLAKAAAAIGISAAQKTQSSSLGMNRGTGTLIVSAAPAAASIPVRRHTFYGDVASNEND